MRGFRYLMIFAALLALTTACSKETTSKEGGKIMTFTAGFADVKVIRNEQGKSEWVQGDKIKVYYDEETYVTATAQSSGTTSSFVTDEEIPAGHNIFIAVYPASRTYHLIDADKFQLSTEDNLEIDYSESIPATFENAAICSATATAENPTFAFRNRCAILKFTTSSKKIHSATYISGSQKSYGVVGTQAIGYKAGTYYIPVLAGENLSFSLRLKNYEGWDYPALVKGPITLEESHIYNLGTIEDALFAEETEGSKNMRLLSFNILRGDLQGPTHLWTNRKNACLAMLAADAPDIFGLMECNSTQRDDILDAFPKYGRVGVAVNGNVYDYATTSSNPIFYDGSKMLLEDWGTYWLSDTPTTKGSYTWYYNKPRTLTWARFKLKKDDTRFVYICVHLQDNKSDIKKEYEGQESYYGTQNRRKSVALIKQLIADNINPNGLPMILSGDLNATYSSSELSGLYDDNIFSLAADIPAPAATDKGYTLNSFVEGGKSRIDHIFCNRCDVRRYVVDRSTYCEQQFISDHWPVYADLVLIAPPSEKDFDSSLEGWTSDDISE